MSSKRIFNTEGTNDEGLRLWHIGDGLTYLYNDDKTSYSDHYWATVDTQRLPGTTVNRVSGRGPKEGYASANPYDFAGGTDLGEFGIAGMELKGVGNSGRNGAHSRKSWFMFDDEVVATGTDINSNLSGSDVETIVDNRKLALDKSNKLTVNGKEQTFTDAGEPVEEKNRSLKVTTVTQQGGKDVKAKKVLADMAANGQVTFSCKVKMDTVKDFFAVKLNGSGDGTEEKNILFLTIRDGAMVPRIPNTNNFDAYNSEAALSAGEWHDLTVSLDMAKQTYNYSFDGKAVEGGTLKGNGATGTDTVDLKNAAFYQSLTGGENKLTSIEITTPGNGTGELQVDDISVKIGGKDAYSESFEDDESESDVDVSTLEGWTVTNNDGGDGAGAKVILEQKITVPNGTDTFNGVHSDTQWIHLDGKTDNSSVGYYFPGGADIEGLRETRKGNWNLVNTYAKFTEDKERVNSFATFWFNHGQTPKDASYSYVVLPGKTEDETEQYNENPDIEILAQTDSVHAVREKNLGITGINFFEAGSYGSFKTEVPQSVMYQKNEEDGTMTISFADPTQTQTAVKLATTLPITEIVSMDEGITAEEKDGVTVFTAESDESPRALAGKSWHVTVRVSENDNTFESIDAEKTPDFWTEEEGTAIVKEETAGGNHVLEIKSEEKGTAKAATTLEFPETEGGSMIRFMLNPLSGAGRILLGEGEEQTEAFTFDKDSLDARKWHEVKIKVNPSTQKYQVMVDGALYGEPKEYSQELTQFTVEVQDGALLLDDLYVKKASIEAPSRPERLTYTAYGDTYVDLAWDAAETDNPVSYIISADGQELEEQTQDTFYKVENLEPGQAHVFTVQAVDDDDNYSEVSDELEVVLLTELNNGYVINFDDYKSGKEAQYDWKYSGADTAGTIEVTAAPKEKDNSAFEDVMTDLEYKELGTATSSDAEPPVASRSDAVKEQGEDEELSTATRSDAEKVPAAEDKVLYVYSGTNGQDKSAEYTFDKQKEKQTYKLSLYFTESVKYTNFALVGSDGKQAVTMMVMDDGRIGYRSGDNGESGVTKPLLDAPAEDEWVDFVIVADPKTQKFSISANDTTVENLQFRNATDSITSLRISAPKGAVGGLYVDNILLPTSEDFGKFKLTEIVDEFDELSVPYGTPFSELELPEVITVNAEKNGETEDRQIRVNWNKKDYDPEKNGSQTITGTLACPDDCLNKISDKKIKIKVTVEKEIKYYNVILNQTAGGTISADEQQAEEGTEVTITAQPDEGYHLIGWMINGKQKAESGSTYLLSVTEDTSVSALFTADPVTPESHYYKVDIGSSTTGGKVEISEAYAKEGTEIVITAQPDSGYYVAVFKVNGKQESLDENNSYSFILTKNTKVIVVFKSVSSDDGSDGTIGNSAGGSSGRIENIAPNAVPSAEGPDYAVKGTWKKEENNWKFFEDSGKQAVSSWECVLWNGQPEWYYFKEDGNMADGWLTQGEQTFYLQITADGNRGRMLTGWQLINDKWYYFNTVSDGSKGAMLKNVRTPDGFYVGADGVYVPEQ